MDAIETLSTVREAILQSIGRLDAMPEQDQLRAFAVEEREHLRDIVMRIESDIRFLRQTS